MTDTEKQKIPKAIREQEWIRNIGNKFSTKCTIKWCSNRITPFDFHVGHNKPESKGGGINIDNLKPNCARCNLSMAANYTITEWNNIEGQKRSLLQKCLCCFS